MNQDLLNQKLDAALTSIGRGLSDLAAFVEELRGYIPTLCELIEAVPKNPTIPSERMAFTQSEVAERLGVSPRTVAREIASRKLTAIRVGGRIPKKEVDRYLDEEVQIAKRKKRVPRDQYKPVIDPPNNK